MATVGTSTSESHAALDTAASRSVSGIADGVPKQCAERLGVDVGDRADFNVAHVLAVAVEQLLRISATNRG